MTDQDELIAAALAVGAQQQEAAEAAGVCAKTVQRRMADEKFRRRVDELRSEIVIRAVSKAAAGAAGAVETLIELTEEKYGPRIRLGAARALLDRLPALQHHLSLTQRLEAALRTIAEGKESAA